MTQGTHYGLQHYYGTSNPSLYTLGIYMVNAFSTTSILSDNLLRSVEVGSLRDYVPLWHN